MGQREFKSNEVVVVVVVVVVVEDKKICKMLINT